MTGKPIQSTTEFRADRADQKNQLPVSGTNPYVGPRPFERRESKFFYGRETETEILTGLVVAHQACLFFAQSGAGKSSLLRAGLIPRLTRKRLIRVDGEARLYQTMHVLPICRVGHAAQTNLGKPIDNIFVFSVLMGLYPDQDPNELAGLSLAEGLKPLLPSEEQWDLENEIRYDPEHPERPPRVRPDSSLLILDQFEEIFNVYPSRWAERENFFRQLIQVMKKHHALHVLLAMREDYIAELIPYANLLHDNLMHRFRMERLQREGALEAIMQPAEQFGRRYAEGVAEELVDNLRRVQVRQSVPQLTGQNSTDDVGLGAYVEPVHLQIVCRDMWSKLGDDQTVIQAEDVRKFGDVDQALTTFYEETIQSVLAQNPPSQSGLSERQLRDWFNDELITPSRTRGLLYQDDEKGETGGLPNRVVDILQNAWLVRSDVRAGDTWIELAHDRMVEPILAANLIWQADYHNPLALAHQSWQRAGRGPEKLLRYTQLEEATAYATANPADVTTDEQQFLEESQRQYTLEQDQARAATRRRRLVTIAATGVILALSALSLIAWNQRQQAVANANVAQENAQIAQANEQEALSQEAIAVANANIAATREAEAVIAREAEEEQRKVAQENEAEAIAQSKLALSRQLAAQAQNELNGGNTDLALLLAIEANRTEETIEANAILHQVLAEPPRTIQRYAGFEDGVINMSLSADSSRMLVETGQGAVEIRDLETDATIQVISDPNYGLLPVWSEDESRILSGSGTGVIDLWDAETGQRLLTIDAHTDRIFAISWNGDESQVLSAGADNTAALWDAETGDELLRLEEHEDAIVQALWNPEDDRIVTASLDGLAIVWDAETGEKLFALDEHWEPLQDVIWSNSGERIVTVSQDDAAIIWNAENGRPIRYLEEHADDLLGAAWSMDDSLLATYSDDGVAIIWDAQSGRVVHTLWGHVGFVRSAAWSEDSSLLATGGWDGTVRIWDAESGEEIRRMAGHTGPVDQLAWMDNEEQIVSGSLDGTVRLWTLSETLDPVGELPILNSHQEGINWISANRTGSQILTASDDGSAIVWNPESGEPLLTLNGHDDWVNQAVWSKDESQILTASDDGTVVLWDAETGEELIVLDGHSDFVYRAHWNPTETMIASIATDGEAILWDAATGDQLNSLQGHDSPATDIVWSYSGDELLSVGDDLVGIVWDAGSGDELLRLEGHGEPVVFGEWHPSDDRIVTASRDTTANIWDAATGEELVTLNHDDAVNQARWSPSGEQILTVSDDRRAIIWDAETGQALNELTGHTSNIIFGLWNSDGSQVLTGSLDSTARLWDAKTGKQLDVLKGHTDQINHAAWNHDETRVLTASYDGTARQFITDLSALFDAACVSALRNMTKEEWGRFMGDVAYQATCPNLDE